ncbi:MAG: glycosyltransferase family 2 protein [Patescibacteria group bacterium]|mgnify:FL=1
MVIKNKDNKLPKVSFVIPARNEEDTISMIYTRINSVMSKIKTNYEIIFIDDGSTDTTYKEMVNLNTKYPKKIVIVKHRGNWGKSIALQSGFKLVRGEITITMDADLQDTPEEIPNFIEKIEEGYDLVSGWKKIRHDPISKTFPSKLGNRVASFLTGVKLHDFNCGFKAYKSKIVKNLNLYGELYKFIPIIAAKKNYKIAEIVIKHKKREFGKSKFGWERNAKGLLDLMTIFFITGYFKKPGHFFGTLGLLSFLVGFVIGIYITYLRITTGGINYRYPLLFLGILAMIIGIQLVTTGLLAELFVYYMSPRENNDDKIEEIVTI